MDPQHVRYFLAVVDHGSVNAAAGAVGVAQPTISQAMRFLERELKTPLFYRIGRGMVPTSAGHALVGPARTILRDMATAAGSVPDAAGRLHGRVDIRAHPSVVSGTLPRLIAEFHRRHPRVHVTVATMYDENRVGALLEEAVCEIVVAHLPVAGRADESGERSGARDLTILELGTQEYDLVLPPAEDSPQLGSMAWDELDEAMVVVPHGTSHARRMFEAMSPRQRARRPAVVVQNREARLAFALAGVGPTWVERSLRDNALKHGARVREMALPLPVPYGLIYHEETLSAAARAFLDIAGEVTGATPRAAVPPATGPSQSPPVGGNVERNPAAAGES